MKIIRKIFVYLLAINIIAIMGGCEEDNFSLELDPVSNVTDATYWKTGEHWKAFMNGIHSTLRGDQLDFLTLGEYRADIFGVQPWTGNTVSGLSIHMNTINEDNPGVSGFAGFYNNINQINLIIDKSLEAEGTGIMSEADRNFYLGQAYGLRAFYYFHLLRSWGSVVINKDPSYGFKIDSLERGASPDTEVMAFIKSDIEKSLTGFGNNYAFKSKGKWSKAATLMLKGEVFLWSSRQMGGGNQDASTAKAALTDIQAKIPSLQLLDDYGSVFSSANKYNDEIIFAIHDEQDEYMMTWLNSLVPRDSHFGENFRDSITGEPYNLNDYNIITLGGGLFYAIYNDIYNGFKPGDIRKYESLGAPYVYENGEYIQQEGTWQNKYKGSFYAGNRIWTDDYPIYRYADLLLMIAEAKSLLGEDPANEINLVRERAYGDNYQQAVQGYPNQPIDSDINEALLKERLYEFLVEGKRWYDLRRFGTEYVTKYTFAQPNRLLWPIDISTLTNNRALTQTPGY